MVISALFVCNVDTRSADVANLMLSYDCAPVVMMSVVNVTVPVTSKLESVMPVAMPSDPLSELRRLPLKALVAPIRTDAPDSMCVPPAWVF